MTHEHTVIERIVHQHDLLAKSFSSNKEAGSLPKPNKLLLADPGEESDIDRPFLVFRMPRGPC